MWYSFDHGAPKFAVALRLKIISKTNSIALAGIGLLAIRLLLVSQYFCRPV